METVSNVILDIPLTFPGILNADYVVKNYVSTRVPKDEEVSYPTSVMYAVMEGETVYAWGPQDELLEGTTHIRISVVGVDEKQVLNLMIEKVRNLYEELLRTHRLVTDICPPAPPISTIIKLPVDYVPKPLPNIDAIPVERRKYDIRLL